jgi:hypothetical protein
MEKMSFKQQIEEAKRVRLSTKEKAVMRTVLLAYMKTSAPRPVDAETSWHAALSGFASRLYLRPVAAVAVFSLALAGIASAAENALPGDPLYTIKVNVNEKVLSVIAGDAKAESELQGKLASRRLKEAEELALKGELDNEQQVAIEERFKAHTGKAKVEIARIKAEEGAAAAAEAGSQVEASLEIHTRILTSIGTQSDLTTQSALFPLVGAVQAETGAITEERVGAESEVTLTANEDTALEKEASAQRRISEARKVLRGNLLSPDIDVEVNILIKKADDALWSGRKAADKKDYAGAVLLFQESSRLSQQATELATTGHELEISVPITSGGEDEGEDPNVAKDENPLEVPEAEANVGEQLQNIVQ